MAKTTAVSRPTALKATLAWVRATAVSSSSASMSSLIFNGEFTVGKKIGSGSFGEVYAGKHVPTGQDVAIKLEPASSAYPQLAHEARVYRRLASHTSSASSASSQARTLPLGFPNLWHHGSEGAYHVLVVDLLGPSLEDLFAFCERRFSLKTVLMLADQLLARLETLHSASILHRDLKPDNFLMGLGASAHLVSVCDFGLAKSFRDPLTRSHVPYREGRNLTGTARYTSLRGHLGIEQSRRDDLESLSYSLLYLLSGSLPWQSLRAHSKTTKYQLIRHLKQTMPVADLCTGVPPEFAKLVSYARGLGFEERPDYRGVRKMFRDCFEREGCGWDWVYSWSGGGNVDKSREKDAHEDWIQGPRARVVQVSTATMTPDRTRAATRRDVVPEHDVGFVDQRRLTKRRSTHTLNLQLDLRSAEPVQLVGQRNWRAGGVWW